MNYLFVLLSFFIWCPVLKAQSFTDGHETRKFVVGKDLSNHEISATEYAFGGNIYKIYFDSLSNNVTLHLRDVSEDRMLIRNGGYCLLFNLTDNEVKWSNKIDYTQVQVTQSGNVLLETYGGESHRIDMKSGRDQTNYKTAVFFTDLVSNTGLGFTAIAKGTSAKLVGVDLTKGTAKWQRDVEQDYSATNCVKLNDSTLVFTARGVHSINLKSGEGWDYKTSTGDQNYKNVTGKEKSKRFWKVVGGTQTTFDATGLLIDVSSNLLKDGNDLFYASQERLAKINSGNGKIMWAYDFKEKEASSSFLFERDSLMYILNFGLVHKNNEVIAYGKPFFAAFSKETGQKVFLNRLPKDEGLLFVCKTPNQIFCLYKHKIAAYNLTTGALIAQKATPSKDDDENIWFAKNNLYINNGDSLSPNF